jgi:hypothetical protein
MTVKIDAMSLGSHALLQHDFLAQLRARTSIALARDSVHDSRLLHLKRQRGQDMSRVGMDL